MTCGNVLTARALKPVRVLILSFCFGALLGFSAENDNNITYRNGEKLRIISKIGVNVLLQGANADFEIYNTFAGSNLVFKVDKRAVGLDVLEVKGESVSNLVAQIAEEMARRHCATVCQARMAALEASLTNLVQTVAGLQETVAVLQERVNAPPTVSNFMARQRYPWNGLVDIKFTIAEKAD